MGRSPPRDVPALDGEFAARKRRNNLRKQNVFDFLDALVKRICIIATMHWHGALADNGPVVDLLVNEEARRIAESHATHDATVYVEVRAVAPFREQQGGAA